MTSGMPEGVLISGGGGGIGRATAVLFARAGARVAILDFDESKGAGTLDQIRSLGGEGAFLKADLSSSREVEAAVHEACSKLSRLDVLVNSAGISGRRWGDGPAADCTEEAWDRVLSINLKGTFLCCKYTIREMLKSGGGAIVNIASVLALMGGDEDFATHAYAASKGGVVSLTRAIAAHYASRGVRANVICPGLIATPMSARAQASPSVQSRLSHLQPLTGNFGRPEDVAQAAYFLASPEAAFITGAVLTVDGGWTVA